MRRRLPCVTAMSKAETLNGYDEIADALLAGDLTDREALAALVAHRRAPRLCGRCEYENLDGCGHGDIASCPSAAVSR